MYILRFSFAGAVNGRDGQAPPVCRCAVKKLLSQSVTRRLNSFRLTASLAVPCSANAAELDAGLMTRVADLLVARLSGLMEDFVVSH